MSVHIEKTAGTSLQKLLCDLFEPSQILIYSTYTDSVLRASNSLSQKRTSQSGDMLRQFLSKNHLSPLVHQIALLMMRVNRHKFSSADLPNGWTAIHGHFKADKFDASIPNPTYITILRDPLARMISHYKYWKSSEGIINHRVRIPYSRSMGFVDFAFHPMNTNYQTQALANKPLENFSLLGTTENYGLFAIQLAYLAKKMGYSQKVEINTPHLNRSPQRSDDGQFVFNQKFLSQFQAHHTQDYENYLKVAELTTHL